eukprot:9595698-Lingulodinium_polyedra.AAC.1
MLRALRSLAHHASTSNDVDAWRAQTHQMRGATTSICNIKRMPEQLALQPAQQCDWHCAAMLLR